MDADTNLIDKGAEQAVLNACLIDPDAFGEIEGLVSAGDFHYEGHRIVFEAIQLLHQARDPIDMLTVTRQIGKDWLSNVHCDGQERGQAYLAKLITQRYTSITSVRKYAQIVFRLGTLRRLMGFAGDVAQVAYNAQRDELSDVFSRIRAGLDAIEPDDGEDHTLYWEQSIASVPVVQERRRREAEEIATGTRKAPPALPWKALKPFIANYLREGTLTIVAAESGVGKTSMLECMAENWARAGHKVAFFHFELSHQAMVDRRTCRWSGVPLEQIERGAWNDAIAKAQACISQWSGNVHYVHCSGWSAQRVTSHARLLHNKGKCDVFVVDYLQKIRAASERGKNFAQVVGDQVEQLKNCAEQLGIVGVLASQFNRNSHNGGRKRAAYIRNTGEAEEKANLILTIDRPILDEDYSYGGQVVVKAGRRSPLATIRVDKNTFGSEGECNLFFVPGRYLFRDIAKENGIH